MNFLRNNFPFFRTNSTSRSRSQSVVSDVSRSSETGDSKKEKDKSYRRKSHLNRAFTDEPVPDCNYTYDAAPKSSKPTSQDPSSLESSAAEDGHRHHHHHHHHHQTKLAVKLYPTIPSVLTSSKLDGSIGNQQQRSCSPSNKSITCNNTFNNQNEQQSISSPLPTTNSHKSSPVVKKDSFSDAEGVSFIKKMLQKESDRDRAAAAAAVPNTNGNSNNSSSFHNSSSNNNNADSSSVGYNIKKSPSAGNQSYWSKFSSSQSAFLRKLFEKPKVSAESTATAASNNNNLNQSIKTSNCSSTKSTTAAAACNGESGAADPPNEKQRAESVLGFSVAQKASFFMKLEHEQRFSKWRKNSIDLGIIGSGVTPTTTTTATTFGEDQENNALLINYSGSGARNFNNENKPKSRFLTRPVTPSEGSSVGISSSNTNNTSVRNNLEFGSLPRIWGNNFQPLENASMMAAAANVVDCSEKISGGDETKASLAIAASSCTDYDDKHHKFNEISTRNLEPISPYTIQPTPPEIKAYSLTRSGRNTGKSSNFQNNLGGSFPMYHSASAIINTTEAANIIAAPSSNGIEKHSNSNNNSLKSGMRLHKNLTNAYSSSSSSFSEAMSNRQEIISAKYPPTNHSLGTPIKNGICNHGGGGDPSAIFGNKYEDKRRGSASDLELSAGATNNQSPQMPRSDKAKSMFISGRNGFGCSSKYHCDSDILSEDGEVSSGGQEVADIICRSYENSPVFRKKNWRTPKAAHSNFTKEIWRRCGNYENWSHRPQPHQPQHRHPVPQTFTATTNVIEVTTIPPTLPSVAASPPPTTSNLLQILTVLSSSNDELSEPKPKSKKHRGASREKIVGGGGGSSSSQADSIPPIHPNHTVVVQPRANSTANHPFYNSTNSSTAVKNCVSAGPINKPSNNHHFLHHQQMSPTVKVDADEIFVSVPHPEDEAFQSFFCSVKSYTQVSHYPPANGVIIAGASSCLPPPNNNDMQQQQQDHNPIIGTQAAAGGAAAETLDMSSVPRESDLLVMKKNVPPCKRKSTGGKYKNPLRALAARMDFRQQGYTQTHSSTNSIQCGSDVDVST